MSTPSNVTIVQTIFCPKSYAEFDVPEYADAMLFGLLKQIERVFWNINQKEWDQVEDPQIQGILFRPFYWGEDETKAAIPNFQIVGDTQKVHWYKYPGRGMTCSIAYTSEQWVTWFDLGMALIRQHEKQYFEQRDAQQACPELPS